MTSHSRNTGSFTRTWQTVQRPTEKIHGCSRRVFWKRFLFQDDSQFLTPLAKKEILKSKICVKTLVFTDRCSSDTRRKHTSQQVWCLVFSQTKIDESLIKPHMRNKKYPLILPCTNPLYLVMSIFGTFAYLLTLYGSADPLMKDVCPTRHTIKTILFNQVSLGIIQAYLGKSSAGKITCDWHK